MDIVTFTILKGLTYLYVYYFGSLPFISEVLSWNQLKLDRHHTFVYKIQANTLLIWC